jgi:hypothetical protein
MSGVIAVAVGSVLALAVGLWAWLSREGRGQKHEMGTISGQWIAEHRSQEREPDGR